MTATVNAAVLNRGKRELRVEPLALRDPGPGEVLVRMTASGLCHSDAGIVAGDIPWPLPAVLGHEGAGVVERVGTAVSRVAVNDTVVLSGIPYCGACFYCTRGQPVLCERSATVWSAEPSFTRPDGTQVGATYGLGTFSEAIVASELCAIKVDSSLPPEQLAVLGCAVMTGVGAVLNLAHVRPGTSVAVIGCGGVGQSMIQGARIAGASQIIAVDPVPLKRATAIKLGATDVVDPASEHPVELVKGSTGGRGADYVLEAVGTAKTFELAWALARPGGTVVVAGGSAGPKVTFSLPVRDAALSGRQLLSCRYGNAQMGRDIPMLARLAASGILDLAALVTSTRSLESVHEGFASLTSGEEIRTVIVHRGPT